MHLNGRIKRILDIEHIFFKIIDRYDFAAGVYDPVLADAGVFVVVQLADIIVCRIAGGYGPFGSGQWIKNEIVREPL